MSAISTDQILEQLEKPLPIAIKNLQTLFDKKVLLASLNTTTKQTACGEQTADGTDVMLCTNVAVFRVMEIEECPECHHKNKEIIVERCIPHALMRWGTGAEFVSPQLDLTDPDDVSDIIASRLPGDLTIKCLHCHHAAEFVNLKNGECTAPKCDCKVFEPDPKEVDELEKQAQHGHVQAERMVSVEHFAFEPDPDDEKLCICGWLIASPVDAAMHDRRHAEHVATEAANAGRKREPAQA